ncbi:MAG: hypothetical protein Tp1125DCM238401_36 [Prokaryotic dsDNA virus sp.]|nr:MAG: hypothetical protein Tp1125DCM238401_36 [Prokaryotic dsDNA virus sp.]|tara:strand:+ start:336 stop:491 length:156 start_codon:yes stop_codon:yes gene_type:complete
MIDYSLTGWELEAWIAEAEDLAMAGFSDAEAAERMDCSVEQVRWLNQYHRE